MFVGEFASRIPMQWAMSASRTIHTCVPYNMIDTTWLSIAKALAYPIAPTTSPQRTATQSSHSYVGASWALEYLSFPICLCSSNSG